MYVILSCHKTSLNAVQFSNVFDEIEVIFFEIFTDFSEIQFLNALPPKEFTVSGITTDSRYHLTQSDLAAKLQLEGIIMERDSISRIEIGTRFVADYELKILSKILKVPVSWLLGIE